MLTAISISRKVIRLPHERWVTGSRWLAVVYKEMEAEWLIIITAYFTSRTEKLFKQQFYGRDKNSWYHAVRRGDKA